MLEVQTLVLKYEVMEEEECNFVAKVTVCPVTEFNMMHVSSMLSCSLV